MKKVIYGLVGISVLMISFGGGWMASTTFSEPKKSTETKPQVISKPERFVDKSNGQGMAPNEMYSELQSLNGAQFDSQYIAYVILMQNNLTGINRLAKEKAENADMKAKATEMWQSSTQTVTDLYALQRNTGYAHH